MESDTTLKSRRAVIGAALGGAAAATIGALALPAAAAAHDPDDVQLGVANAATAATSIESSDTSIGAVSLAGTHALSGIGVRGASAQGVGMFGACGDDTGLGDLSGAGVVGYADPLVGMVGIAGLSDAFIGALGSGMLGVYGSADSIGVIGEGADAGVYGTAYPGGIGVLGIIGAEPTTMPTNVAVYARAADPATTALQVSGKVRLSRSGRVSIASSATAKTVSMAGVTTGSYIIATMQTNVSGLYVRAVVPAAGSFRIYLSKAPGKTAWVGYLVVN